MNRKNLTPGLDLSRVAPSVRLDRAVRWNPEMRPTAAPDLAGSVFMSKGRETWVTWSDGRTQRVYTGALVLA